MSNVTVATVADLSAALKVVQSGDTIYLQAGVYSGVQFRDVSFAKDVTITSADPGQRAVLMDVSVLRASGLTFSGLEFKTGGTGFGVNVSKSQGIHFDQDFIHGSLDGNAQNDGAGLGFLDSSSISITNSEFTQLRQAVGLGTDATASVSDIYVAGNYIHGVAKSGLVFAGASYVTVTGNTISDIRPAAGDHPDAIQFFTTGTKAAAHDIVVSNNVILRGDGDATQGIFFRDQTGAMPFHHVAIDNNLIVGTGYGGIYVMGASDLEISGNKLVSNPGATNNTFFLVQGADGVVATNNQAQSISFDKVTHLTQQGNVTTPVVTDGGVADILAWTRIHPEAAAMLSAFSMMPAPTEAPTAFADPGSTAHPLAPIDPAFAMEPTGWQMGNLFF